ncbi:MAG: hypothetical protein NTY77_06905 [Elusimicrobia bacterium]|nr:hypothetical protein [Elusimicrobiota bacterium]
MPADRVRTRSILAGMIAAAAALAWPAGASAVNQTGVEFATGYRIDSFAFDIAGVSGPNVISELTWKSLQIYQIEARAHAENDYGIYAKAMADYGWILHGKNQDSDYDGDNRTLEWSRSNNTSNGAYVWDSSFGLGYDFHPSQAWSLIPLMGASISTQKLVNKNGYQTIAGCSIISGACTPAVGAFPGLNSSYTAEWWGPWNGLDVQYAAGPMLFAAGAEYHWGTAYTASGDWNLMSEHFSDHSHGSGVVAGGSVGYALDQRWTLRAEGKWQDFTANKGTATTSVGGASGSQPFNHAHWTSASGSLGVEYRF